MATKSLGVKHTRPTRTLIIDVPRSRITKDTDATTHARRMKPRTRKRLAKLLRTHQRYHYYRNVCGNFVICGCTVSAHGVRAPLGGTNYHVDEDCDPLASPSADTDGMERLTHALDTLDVHQPLASRASNHSQ